MDIAVIDSLTGLFKAPLLWLSSKANRKRLGGARVEIVVVLIRRTPTPSLLIVRSVYEDTWLFPQEGVHLNESLLAAVGRGLREEVGLRVLDESGNMHAGFYLRDMRYVGTLLLPPERWGERPVAGNLGDSPLASVRMKRKAYWSAFVLADPHVIQTLTPRASEIVDARWVTFDEASRLLASNRPEKRQLLDEIVRHAYRHTYGAREAWSWIPRGSAPD